LASINGRNDSVVHHPDIQFRPFVLVYVAKRHHGKLGLGPQIVPRIFSEQTTSKVFIIGGHNSESIHSMNEAARQAREKRSPL
jgi:hypothetical protein